jgi:hypothetical protein
MPTAIEQINGASGTVMIKGKKKNQLLKKKILIPPHTYPFTSNFFLEPSMVLSLKSEC